MVCNFPAGFTFNTCNFSLISFSNPCIWWRDFIFISIDDTISFCCCYSNTSSTNCEFISSTSMNDFCCTFLCSIVFVLNIISSGCIACFIFTFGAISCCSTFCTISNTSFTCIIWMFIKSIITIFTFYSCCFTFFTIASCCTGSTDFCIG